MLQFPDVNARDHVRIGKTHSQLTIATTLPPGDYIVLYKQNAIQLAAEITNWCETGEFIKPKKKFVAVWASRADHFISTEFFIANDIEAAKRMIKNFNDELLAITEIRSDFPFPED